MHTSFFIYMARLDIHASGLFSCQEIPRSCFCIIAEESVLRSAWLSLYKAQVAEGEIDRHTPPLKETVGGNLLETQSALHQVRRRAMLDEEATQRTMSHNQVPSSQF